jgi:uncharacterized membrane protein
MEGAFFIIIVILIVFAIIIVKLNSMANKSNKNALKINKHIIMTYRKLEALESSLLENGIKPKEIDELNKEIENSVQQIENMNPNEKTTPVIEEKKELLIKPEVKKVIDEPVKNTQPIGTVINGRKKNSDGKWIDIGGVNPEKISNVDTVKPKRSNTDWEKLIGENLLNKIGIAVLVIGIGFFVKYAIDQEWIGEYGRVSIGIGVGAILIGIAHFMRKDYKTFSSVLIGGGIGVFYYTISIAYQDYHIFTQPVAFVIMTIITIISVILSIIYDKKEIAIIGLIGGFTSPFMVQGETDNYVAFFTYIAILNTGMLALSYYKKWNVIIKLAYGFTILFFGAWLITRLFSSNPMPHQFALLMSAIYYLQFLGMSLVYNIKQHLKFNAFEFIQILSINALFFLAGITILNDYKDGDYQGLFTLLLAGFNFVIFFLLSKIELVDTNLKQVFLGKTVSFITLAILLQFDAHYSSLFWALESVIILWLGQRNNQAILKQASVIITLITTLGLVYSWSYQLNHSFSESYFNPYLFSSFGVIISYTINVVLLNKEDEGLSFFGLPISIYKNGLAFWGYLAFYFTILIVLITHQSNFEILANIEEGDYVSPYESYALYRLIIWGYTLLMIVIGFTFTKIKQINLFREFFAILSILSVIAYVLFGNSNTINLRDVVLNYGLPPIYFYAHFLIVAIIIYLLFMFRKVSFEIFKDSDFNKWAIVLVSIVGVFIASMEFDHMGIFGYFKAGENSIIDILHHTQREGYTTLWGAYSFLLMFYGMRNKIQHIRILALILFAVALLKLFIIDIKNMSDTGKIIAFISLGVLLLIVSFLYQKLRKIIIGEEKIKTLNEEENEIKIKKD